MKGRGFNHFPAVIRALPGAAHKVVEKVTNDIAAGAGATAPVDTGALAESYYAEVEGLHGVAGTNIDYGPHVEYGTVHTGAQPHLGPSAERVAHGMGQYARLVGLDVERAARNG